MCRGDLAAFSVFYLSLKMFVRKLLFSPNVFFIHLVAKR